MLFRSILTLLQTLEWGEKLIHVERLDLSRLPNASEDERTETLSLSATISGFALPAESAGPTGSVRDSATARGVSPTTTRREGTP